MLTPPRRAGVNYSEIFSASCKSLTAAAPPSHSSALLPGWNEGRPKVRREEPAKQITPKVQVRTSTHGQNDIPFSG